MTAITSGRIVYSRTVKTGDYENKKFEIEYCFNVDDGQDAGALTDQVGGMCVEKCHIMLGLAKAKSAADTKTITGVESGGKEAAAAAMNAKDKPKAEIEAEETPPKRKAGRPPNTTKKTTEADELDAPTPQTKEQTKVEVDEDFDTPSDAPEITDVDLTTAASRKNAELAKTHAGAAPAMIRGLRDKFFADPTGKTLRDIPQDKRKAFLEQLEALK